MEQGLALAQRAQGHEGLDGPLWRRRLMHVTARERIEHPRGHGELKALLELDDQTIRGLTS